MDYVINEYQVRLDAQRFLWPVNYIALYYIEHKRLGAAGLSWLEHFRV